MNLGTEAVSEFWTSLNLISTQPEEENEFGDCLNSYLGKSAPSAPNASISTNCKVLETQSLPITSIISRIQAEDSGSDDEMDKHGHPPPSYTGGKWKPTVSQSLLAIGESAVERKGTDTAAEKPKGDSTAADDRAEADEELTMRDLTCLICNKTFTKVENIVVHLTSQKHRHNITEDKRRLAAQLYTQYHTELVKRSAYQCACCTFAATEHGGLVTHMKSQQHTENVSKLAGPMECVSCHFLDYDGSSMLQHCLSEEHQRKAQTGTVTLKQRRSQIKCLRCSKTLHSTLHYTRHMKNQHLKTVSPNSELIKCDFCDFEGKPSTVHQHISRTHRNKRPFYCKVCETDYYSKYDLYKHQSTIKHVDKVFDSFKQSVTFGITSTPSSVATDDPVNNKPAMRCHFCIFTTSELSSLHEHYTRLHKEEQVDENMRGPSTGKPVFCRFCHKQLMTVSELFNHELSHVKNYLQTSDYNNMENCFICSADIDSNAIDLHLLQHNPYNRKRAATELEEKNSKLSTGNVSDGTYHICGVAGCNRTYKSKGDLNVHRATHTGEKRFTCDQCDKCFNTGKQLKAHNRTHSSIKPFSCDYCDYKCKTRCHLQRHMRIHAGSKPYSCPYCQYSSTTIGNLRKHLLQSSKHKDLPMYECTQSGCYYVADKAIAISDHLTQVHKISANNIMVKSTENDWTDIIEGHSIIATQHG